MSETSATATARTSVRLHLAPAASILLLVLFTGCASTAAPAPSGEPRKVTGCRFEPAHFEEVYRCSPNPGTGRRLVCSHRNERIPERWWLEYESGEPRQLDEETCNAEGERKRWECHEPDGHVYLDEPPTSCV
jgi:hypothetical protein